MAGIYIIKSKDGSSGYIGLDSGASKLKSGRLIDHVAHAYNVVGREIKRGQITMKTYGDIPDRIQNCEINIAQATPSNFEYFLNTDAQNEYYGLPAEKYRDFSQIWKTNGKHKAQSWAEICYIYHYRTTWANLNSAWGGNLKYTYNLKNFIDIDKLSISESLKKKLSESITWEASHSAYSIHDIDHMKKLFYPELQLKDKLLAYGQEQINILIKELVHGKDKTKAWVIKVLKGEESDLFNQLDLLCKKLSKEANCVLKAISEHSQLLDPQSSIQFKVSKRNINSLVKQLELGNIRRDILYSDKASLSMFSISENIKYKNNTSDTPNWFPSVDSFNINKFQKVSTNIKENVLTNIFPLTLRQANSAWSGVDYNTTEKYFQSNLTNLYNGILSKGITFSEYYNTMMNYWKRSIEGPFIVTDFGGKDFIVPGVQKVRRESWPEEVFLTVPLEFLENMQESANITFNQVTVW